MYCSNWFNLVLLTQSLTYIVCTWLDFAMLPPLQLVNITQVAIIIAIVLKINILKGHC